MIKTKKPKSATKKKFSSKDRHEVKETFLKENAGHPLECLGCGKIFHPPYYIGMHCHHLLPVEKFPHRFWDTSIITPLCKKCHNKVHWALNAYRASKRR